MGVISSGPRQPDAMVETNATTPSLAMDIRLAEGGLLGQEDELEIVHREPYVHGE